LWKPFQLLCRIPNDVSITEALSLQCWFHSEQVKWTGARFRRLWVDAPCYHIVLCKTVDQNRPVCWSIVVKEKPTIGSPFFGAFPSGRISKATKDASIYFCIRARNSYKLYQRIPGAFWSYYVCVCGGRDMVVSIAIGYVVRGSNPWGVVEIFRAVQTGAEA
jgi:hypothetical protein